ncbi:uncharacterized protein LOC105281536 isoform X2 [Ooceraea biroi]|uniref:uncharacterized protein LOC105281536 isoform X2 n=1 Tax=Ooceraea biroi TaxID=2015173 RepID=UPI000F0958CD|nr:uncharacterized protein LOC105281536 isoform X2 [Ooceraea biroi]
MEQGVYYISLPLIYINGLQTAFVCRPPECTQMKVGHLVSYRSAHARRFPLLYVYEYNILTKGCGRTFYRFPLSDKFMLEQWLKQIPMKHWTPNKDSLLCSDHFTENCFDKSAFQVTVIHHPLRNARFVLHKAMKLPLFYFKNSQQFGFTYVS